MKIPRSCLHLLKDLVSIPSVLPGGETGGSLPGEAAVANYVAAFLRGCGADVELQEVEPGRPNVIARFRATKSDRPTVALIPHLDTVGVAGMTVKPFQPKVRGGRLYGRGACDTKGPMAAALWALRGWSRRRATREFNVVFAATMGEEELSVGASALCWSGFRVDFAVVLEPTDLKVVHAAKGVVRLWVRADGRAAHGSTPELGQNAVYAMAPFLRRCREVLAPRFARARHPVLGSASINLGVMRGGTELNIVPEACEIGLDIRTHPNFDHEKVLNEITAAADGLRLDVYRSGPSFSISRENPWLRSLAKVGHGFAAVPWFSDANVLNAHGIPAVAFGPGSIAQAHTADEFITLEALESGARAFEALLRNPIFRTPPPTPVHSGSAESNRPQNR